MRILMVRAAQACCGSARKPAGKSCFFKFTQRQRDFSRLTQLIFIEALRNSEKMKTPLPKHGGRRYTVLMEKKNLPTEFLRRMEAQLGVEYPAFLKSYGCRPNAACG